MSTGQSKVAVILLTMNQRDKTLRCLNSFEAVHRPKYRIILWDNGSQDGTVDAVNREYPNVITHHHPENIGVASGRNKAARLAIDQTSPEYLLFMDNDMTVSPNLLEALVAPFDDTPMLAQTTGKILDMDDSRRIYGAGGNRIRFWLGDTKHLGYGEVDRGQYDTPKPCIPSGGCLFVKTKIFQEIGGFDPCFDPYGPEDLDFGLKVAKAGYSARYVPNAILYHESKPGRTFEGGLYTEKFAALRVQHWFTFMKRHASNWEILGFLLIGIPYLLCSFVVRQARRGNLRSSLRVLFRGTFNAISKSNLSG